MSKGKLLGSSLRKQEAMGCKDDDNQIGKVKLGSRQDGPLNFMPAIKADNRIGVKIKCTSGAKIPEYAHNGDSGFDFICLEKIRVYPNQTVLVKTGLFMEIPEGYEIQVRPRSGLSLRTKLRVANSPGTIDSTYRGEIGVIITNHGKDKVLIHKDEKFAQGVICPVYQAKFELVEELNSTDRSDGGYGSTD